MTPGNGAARRGEAGFTLIEMIVALALFALISLAAVALVETVLGVQRRTDGRLDRLASLDRAVRLIDADFTALREGPVLNGGMLAFRRNAREGVIGVGYALIGGALVRLRGATPRPLVIGVDRVVWRFHRRRQGWVATPGLPTDRERPDAVELTLTLAPQDGAPGGTLRRVVPLPTLP